ncbi:unnamed protein product [Brassicogethes aeneus]|uniref:non-specific serine/threonine protein kinase n=1 Tax=Brassicogethes aeneus TaxID=1431903 RepID=A0A9P0FE83_BRAAE|nr:unnamed protein product [Brassicogethes aeneus]
MEASKDAISVRVARINSNIVGKAKNKERSGILTREALLDTLQVLYDECTIEQLQKYDANIAKFAEKYKQALKEIKQLRVNITDFEIKNVIGRGHFGEVHMVKEKQTGDVYAMKTIRKSDVKGSYEEERNIMAFGHSPWLTLLQYAFQDQTYLFFVMEYHPGGDLLGLLYRQGGTLPESAATFYIAELVLALADLHSMGYVHRDVKPDNLLLDRCGHLKLADFGSAAKINEQGFVTESPPVGTPDYIAPEVLQSLENNKKNAGAGYGVCCDFWSLGVLAYELTIGNTPFAGQNTTSIYGKIMNHSNHLKFPPDVTLSQAYVSFIKGLVTDQQKRLNAKQIKSHVLFKNTRFENLLNEVPPYVPKILSADDTSNFSDVQSKKKTPSVENFKKRTQFTGKNLPFVGFTFTHDPDEFENPYGNLMIKDEAVKNLKSEVTSLQKKLIRNEENAQQKKSMETKFQEKCRKLETLESLRDQLERDIANNIAECTALKRTLELERKDRVELERKALELIKSAKTKWEGAEKVKIDGMALEIEQQKVKIAELTATNKMLNDQLKRALQSEGAHRESLETVHNLSRRSVVGLESRLERITSDSQNAIHDLQSKLSREIFAKLSLEKELRKLKDSYADLTKKLETSLDENKNLGEKLKENENQVAKIAEKLKEMEKLTTQIKTYKNRVTDLQNTIDNGQKIVKDFENKLTLLKMDNKNLEEQNKLCDSQRNELNKKIREIESQLVEEQDKNASLKTKIKESENSVTESQELREFRTKLWRMEKEFSNCKIDKRIVERELKEAQEEIKTLTEKISKFDEKVSETKKSSETALLEMSRINEDISLELMKMKDSYRNLQEKLENERKKSDDEETIIKELKKICQNGNEKIASMNREIATLEMEKKNMENHVRKNESEKARLLDLVDNLQKEKSELFNNLEKSNREIKNIQLNLEALREASTLLENQVIEYERIIKSFEEKESSLNSNTEKLIKDLCNAKTEIQEAKKLANEQKSLKLLAETKVKRCNEDVQCLQGECKSYKEQCVEYKKYSTQLSEELTMAEEKIADLEMTAKTLERQNKDCHRENNILKEELTDHLTKINSSKEHNYKLNHQLRDVQESRSVLAQQLQELERIFAEKINYYKERELKAEATIGQQIKLIDYLQTKIDENSQKKRTISDRLFGSSKKENHPPIMAMNYKDLEQQLSKERSNSRKLQEEIFRLKAEATSNATDRCTPKVERHRSEVANSKIREAMREIVNSPGHQKEMLRQNSSKRMHHNIPHRFESKMCSKPTQCAQCGNQVMLGRHVSTCTECHVHVHAGCAQALPRTCGLPHAFAEHFRESLTKLSVEKESANGRNEESRAGCGPVQHEGWIKIPSKSNTWEKRYASLSENYITVYSEPPSPSCPSTPLEQFELKPEDTFGRVILEPLASEIDVPVASSDLPFIIKVEVGPKTTCWPPKNFVLMTLSAQETDKWYNALQNAYQDDQAAQKPTTILTLPDGITVNCITDLTENIKILGTDKGLYSYHNETLLHIDGPTSVQQIATAAGTNCVAMIVNQKSVVISCDLNHLINLTQCASCTKPALKHQNVKVNGLTGFQFLNGSSNAKQHKIAVATVKQLVILTYDFEVGEFVAERVLDTAEPISCALFTDNTIIVGADKFFEIDLSTYEAEEFLDVSDAKLKHAAKCHKMGSFPLSVVETNKNPREYLLCFNEFSIFVDEYGRSSRSYDLKSTLLPLAFHHVKPYLFISQFNGVELLNIPEHSDETVKIITRLDVGKMSYLGGNKKGVYVVQNNAIKYVDIKMLLQADDDSLLASESAENSGSDRFSFTSSMVQSLDGNVSDDEADKVKKVTFCRTEM